MKYISGSISSLSAAMTVASRLGTRSPRLVHAMLLSCSSILSCTVPSNSCTRSPPTFLPSNFIGWKWKSIPQEPTSGGGSMMGSEVPKSALRKVTEVERRLALAAVATARAVPLPSQMYT